jgi:Ca2+-binding RTX toxin-like protein
MGLSDHSGLSRVLPRRAEHASRRAAVLTVWLATLAAASNPLSPATATAAEVKFDDFNPGALIVEDAGVETNEMTVRVEPGEPGEPAELVFADTGVAVTTTAAPECNMEAPGVRCSITGVLSLTAKMGGGGDTFELEDSVAVSIANVSIWGGAGVDRLTSGLGRQVILGDSDGDIIDAGPGNDVCYGLGGDDSIAGGEGPDQLLGGADVDALDGGEGADDVRGGPGPDRVAGGDGDDRLEVPDAAALTDDPTAGQGPDTVLGGRGDDRLGGGPEAAAPDADVFSGGAGRDTMDYAPRRSPLSVMLDGRAEDGAQGERDNVEPDVETVVGGDAGDTLVGSDSAELLDGGLGNDLLDGRGGADVLEAGANDPGNDRLFGGDGADTLRGRAGDDELAGGPEADDLSAEGGDDLVDGEAGQDTVEGGSGLDEVRGGDGDDTLYGGGRLGFGADGDDRLYGGSGDDQLLGGLANDGLDGGPGADRMSGGAGDDTVSYQTRTADIEVTFDGIANDGERGEGDNVDDDVETILGGTDEDTLTGDRRPNILSGARGEDLLSGGAGADTLSGGTDGDLVRARDDGPDVVSCEEGRDLAIVDASETSIVNCEYVDRPGRRPVFGRRAVVKPPGGRYRLRLPRGHRFFRLTGELGIPFASTVRPGKRGIRLATATTRRGASRRAWFSGGAFSPRQRRAKAAATVLRLVGGNFAGCRASDRRGARTTAAAPKAVRRLRAEIGHRKRKRTPWVYVRGRYSIGGARGTTWLTEDRCDGTWTRALDGTVHVRDLVRNRTVVLHAGEDYLARG